MVLYDYEFQIIKVADPLTTEETPERIIHPKNGAALMLLLGSLTFVIAGLLEVWIGYFYLGCITIGFFSMVMPVGIVQLIPGRAYLRIADDGVSYHGLSVESLFGVTSIPWSVISRIFILSVNIRTNHSPSTQRNRFVACTFVPSYNGQKLMRFISYIFGYNAFTIPTPCGQNVGELAQLLIRYHKRFKELHDESEPYDEVAVYDDESHLKEISAGIQNEMVQRDRNSVSVRVENSV